MKRGSDGHSKYPIFQKAWLKFGKVIILRKQLCTKEFYLRLFFTTSLEVMYMQHSCSLPFFPTVDTPSNYFALSTCYFYNYLGIGKKINALAKQKECEAAGLWKISCFIVCALLFNSGLLNSDGHPLRSLSVLLILVRYSVLSLSDPQVVSYCFLEMFGHLLGCLPVP